MCGLKYQNPIKVSANKIHSLSLSLPLMSTSCSLLPLTFKPIPFHRPNLFPQSRLSNPNHPTFSITLVRSTNQEREETRWLREEQRWLREEQRWLREESRWHAERDSLIQTISALKLQIEEFEVQRGENVTNSANLLPIVNRIAEIGSVAVPLVLEAAGEEREEVEVEKSMLGEREEVVVVEEGKKKRGTLRSGCEGDDVREMQEALQKLGFYCGEEDVEFSSFSTSTERAVKTWQASLGAPEDGIMTAELQEILYTEGQVEYSGMANANGATVASVTEISEIRKKVMEDESNTEIDVSKKRVFLLGENRWEEPSRLISWNKADGGANSKGSTIKCISCRGVGRLLCAECDGSGEPNIEEQFLEWVDEGMKCPYCEGGGFTTCDVCDGKGEALV